MSPTTPVSFKTSPSNLAFEAAKKEMSPTRCGFVDKLLGERSERRVRRDQFQACKV